MVFENGVKNIQAAACNDKPRLVMALVRYFLFEYCEWFFVFLSYSVTLQYFGTKVTFC